MRPDLAKCTTESMRAGGSYCTKTKYGGRIKPDPDPEADYLDEYGGFRSSARHRHHEYKHLTDALGALRGNLRANVGRPWSKVYSEFCRSLDRRSVAGHHIWTHLMQEVEVNTYVTQRGEVYCLSSYGGPGKVYGYYVDPDTGILRYREYRGRHRNKHNKVKLEDVRIPVPETPDMFYERINGLWFRVLDIREDCGPNKTIVTGQKRWSANRREIQWIRKELAKSPIAYATKISHTLWSSLQNLI